MGIGSVDIKLCSHLVFKCNYAVYNPCTYVFWSHAHYRSIANLPNFSSREIWALKTTKWDDIPLPIVQMLMVQCGDARCRLPLIEHVGAIVRTMHNNLICEVISEICICGHNVKESSNLMREHSLATLKNIVTHKWPFFVDDTYSFENLDHTRPRDIVGSYYCTITGRNVYISMGWAASGSGRELGNRLYCRYLHLEKIFQSNEPRHPGGEEICRPPRVNNRSNTICTGAQSNVRATAYKQDYFSWYWGLRTVWHD